MFVLNCNAMVPWDNYFPSREAAARFLDAIKWPEFVPGALYGERYWSLGATIRWIIDRIPEAIDSPLASEAAAQKAVCELQEALEAGEITSSGSLYGNPISEQPAGCDLGHSHGLSEDREPSHHTLRHP